MIKVYKFGPAFGMPDASPFVVKVETYLRMTDQKYETVVGDVRKAPRAQLPYADIDGKIVADSTAIVDRLEGARAQKLDAHLDAAQSAVALAFKLMLEEYLYFGLLHLRWATDDGWSVFEPELREMLARMGIPALVRPMISKVARRQSVGRTRSQGIGRQPRAELVGNCNKAIDALSVQLSDRPYFCGDRPTTYDATVYAFTTGALCPAFNHEVRKHTESKNNLVSYADRLKNQYWKEMNA